jgi:hypothetical protein
MRINNLNPNQSSKVTQWKHLAATSLKRAALALMALMVGVSIHTPNGRVAAQEPTTQVTNLPHLSLVPLVILNIGSGEISFPVSSPTGAPRPIPEFFLPRNGAKEITVTTSGGSANVRFFNSVPPGVSSTAFQWQQSSLAAGNAVGRLEYSGCASCPASFTLEVTASSNDTVHASAKITLTASSGRPAVNGITANGGDQVEPKFEIRFQQSTFDTSDSQIVATYASGLRYRLIPESNTQIAEGRINVIVPRLEVDRTVRVALVNPFGSSGNTNVTLPQEGIIETPVFEQVNASGEFPNSAQVGDTFSVKHTNNGLLDGSGSDDITIQPLAASSSCNQRDYIFQSARVSWLDDHNQPVTTPGPISIVGQPATNASLRSPNNKIRVNWTLKARFGDVFYQVLYRGVEVVGVCSDRVVH